MCKLTVVCVPSLPSWLSRLTGPTEHTIVLIYACALFLSILWKKFESILLTHIGLQYVVVVVVAVVVVPLKGFVVTIILAPWTVCESTTFVSSFEIFHKLIVDL